MVSIVDIKLQAKRKGKSMKIKAKHPYKDEVLILTVKDGYLSQRQYDRLMTWQWDGCQGARLATIAGHDVWLGGPEQGFGFPVFGLDE